MIANLFLDRAGEGRGRGRADAAADGSRRPSSSSAPGPIVIGQAAEFDYSGTQACRVLRAEGLRVVLVNSNPATIMTDPEFADATYVEPITPDVVEAIIAKERPDALLATLGGQTALNTAMALNDAGVLDKYGVELIGANVDAIEAGEDRQRFKEVVERIAERDGLPASVARSGSATRWTSASRRPRSSATRSSSARASRWAASAPASPTTRTTCAASPAPGCSTRRPPRCSSRSRSSAGRSTSSSSCATAPTTWSSSARSRTSTRWACTPGDSITVAPALTLTDREYQVLRDIGIAVIREVGVDTGGCNIQFAVNPRRRPRRRHRDEPAGVAARSALASKATGFPIAKIAARLAVGYTLDEIPNDITAKTPASFEPTLDYVVVKVPRFAFEKFPSADDTLTTTMKSVGEAMAIGRCFTEALQKALRSLEQRGAQFRWDGDAPDADELAAAARADAPADAAAPRPGAARRPRAAPRSSSCTRRPGSTRGSSTSSCLLDEVARSVADADVLTADLLREAKRHGFSDEQIGRLRGMTRGRRPRGAARPRRPPGLQDRRHLRRRVRRHAPRTTTRPTTRRTRRRRRERRKVIILGSGPNRIGQGIEFDYSCVHASFALRDAGYETIMVNCNPETVSTDYDTSDRLYFEPLTLEDVLEVVHAEQRAGELAGVHRPARRADPAGPRGAARGRRRADRRHQPRRPSTSPRTAAPSARCWPEAGLPAPSTGRPAASTTARAIADEIGYPVLVRPSYVLGGRGMEIVDDEAGLADYLVRAGRPRSAPSARCSSTASSTTPSRSTSTRSSTAHELYLGGVMEHIEQAGIHSGDSACVLPPVTLGAAADRRASAAARRRSPAVSASAGCSTCSSRSPPASSTCWRPTRGPAGPRRSSPRRPAVPLAKAAARIMLGATIADLRAEGMLPAEATARDLPDDAPLAVKEAVLPFKRFRTADRPLRRRPARPRDAVHRRGDGHRRGLPARRSPSRRPRPTAACPPGGRVFVSVADARQARHDPPGQAAGRPRLRGAGHRGHRRGAASQRHRQHAWCASTAADRARTASRRSSQQIYAGEVDMVVNTPSGAAAPRLDGYEIRAATTSVDKPIITTVQQLAAAVQAIEAAAGPVRVRSLQEHAHRLGAAGPGAGHGVPGTRPQAPPHRHPAPGAGRERSDRRVLLPPVALATRRDAEVAMDAHLRAMRAMQARPALLRLAARRHGPAGPAARPGPAGRAALPAPVRRRRRLRQERRRVPRVRGALHARLRRGGDGHPAAAGRQPPPAAVQRLPGGHLVNAMGFPTAGAEAAAANLLALPAPTVPLGVNVGKLKDTPDEEAAAEYAEVVRRFGDPGGAHCRTTTSSTSPRRTPPGCAALQEGGRLVGGPRTRSPPRSTSSRTSRPRPRRRLLVKLAPELGPAGLEAVAELVLRHDTGGLVLTNTRAADDRARGRERPRPVRPELGDGAAGGRPAARRPGSGRHGRRRQRRAGVGDAAARRPRRRLHRPRLPRSRAAARAARTGSRPGCGPRAVPSLAALRAPHRPSAQAAPSSRADDA